jgi:hypothetical protein
MFGRHAGGTKALTRPINPRSRTVLSSEDAIVVGPTPGIRSTWAQERELVQRRIRRTREAYARLRRSRLGAG